MTALLLGQSLAVGGKAQSRETDYLYPGIAQPSTLARQDDSSQSL